MNKKQRKQIKQQAAYEEAKAFMAQHALEQESNELQTLEHFTKPPKTSFDQIKETGSNLIVNLICVGFVVAIILFIIGGRV